ncbi:transposase family protein [Streptomyces adelaidensis]|uniref:transposase family protein n=1 Tax=Streptomyces adelaidensis TaxID=2796465 RepID=UPI0035592F9C
MRVERCEDGGRRVHLATADASARACPACGAFASRVKGSATTRPRDLPYGERGLEFLWHKRRWWCREPACPAEIVHRADPADPGRQAADREATEYGRTSDTGVPAPRSSRPPVSPDR